ncbi:MAG: hypothetical protein MI864_01805, partial [Pseudomonadales bacterium]|nr:hypothetical protein [Pseudomonadales bacterium]
MDVVQKTADRNLASGEGVKSRNLADPGTVTDVQKQQFKDILQGADESPSPQNQALPANQSRPVNEGLKNNNVERDLPGTEASRIEMESEGSTATSLPLTEPVQVGSQGAQHSSREQPSRELSKASGVTDSTRIGAAQLLESKAPESITKHSDPSNFPEKTPSVEGKHTDTDLRAAHRADQGAFIPWPSAPSQTSLSISDTRMPIGLPEDMTNMSDLDSMLE